MQAQYINEEMAESALASGPADWPLQATSLLYTAEYPTLPPQGRQSCPGWIPLLSNSHSKTCSLEALKCPACASCGHPTVDRDGERRWPRKEQRACAWRRDGQRKKKTAVSRVVSGTEGRGHCFTKAGNQTPALLEAIGCQSDSGRMGSACPSKSCVLLHLWTGDQ